MAAKHGHSSTYVQCQEDECIGVNSQLELSLLKENFKMISGKN